MIFSMTGFAALEQETSAGVLLMELRSVNHRYLELQLKLDDSVRNVEPVVRELVTARLGRGKVECRISLVRSSPDAAGARLDSAALLQLAELSRSVQQQFPASAPLSVADILRWPGVVLGDEGPQHDDLAQQVRAGLEVLLDDMRESRAREGGKLKAIILDRLAQMEALLAQLKPLLPLQVQAYQQRLMAKLQEAVKQVDEERLRQELVLFAQKVDVDEELGRLDAHIAEVRRILDADSAAGKRLDFLMQELNREANTLGAKSISSETSQVSMSLKLLIEQMREQIQNIE